MQTHTTTDPRILPPEDCVLSAMLERNAERTPDAVYAVFQDGSEWSFAETLRQTRRAAAGLQALGVRQDDRVLIALPNGPDALRVWFGANYIGAVAVHVNPAYRGGLLERVISNSGAEVLVCAADMVEPLTHVSTGGLKTIVTFGQPPAIVDGVRLLDARVLDGAGETPDAPARAILPFDLQCIIYTSGTTGPSKGVMCSYLHVVTAGRAVYFLDASDRYLVNLPIYHIAGILPCMLMLSLGGSVAVIERFKTDQFWATIAATRATFAILLGVMTRYLLSQPEVPAEKAGHLRYIIQQPFDDDAPALRERFNIDIYTSFNMTEVSLPIVSEANPPVAGTCGRARDGVELRIVDAHDCEVPTGDTGELIIRTDRPWAMMHGYYNDPEATARAWRNGWFHTGDVFRRNEDGYYFFVDRLKDAIRRRGENISSFEVEAAVMAHPAIREAAAVATESEISESEVMVVVSLRDNASLDPADLIRFLSKNLTYFMIPRYVRILPDLPKTPTQKIEKHILRSVGRSRGDVWDREAAGLRIQRN
ncbi:crotonobetaine/carnitine-CoA ligase [Hoeflea marina]|uniref:Crotonobetaine/carnitine-CoA ligase n=1 Tax=Hoeflea marina TaxID=274592 RepID=A0A317PCJ0_9HYPH|nr:AMP-binding protein [Hoeflea marina]PWV95778.1 crotonobetaine/carnitine-CoA ligase [Hoeflea marina]